MEELARRIVFLVMSNRHNGCRVIDGGLEEAILAPNVLPEDRRNGEDLNMAVWILLLFFKSMSIERRTLF